MAMDEKARAARNEYRRAWAKRNPDKVKGQQERYWSKKAAADGSQNNRTTPATTGNR